MYYKKMTALKQTTKEDIRVSSDTQPLSLVSSPQRNSHTYPEANICLKSHTYNEKKKKKKSQISYLMTIPKQTAVFSPCRSGR